MNENCSKLQILIGIISTYVFWKFNSNYSSVASASNLIRDHFQNVRGWKLRVLGQCDFMTFGYWYWILTKRWDCPQKCYPDFSLTASKTQKIILIRESFILMFHSDMRRGTIQAIPLVSIGSQVNFTDFQPLGMAALVTAAAATAVATTAMARINTSSKSCRVRPRELRSSLYNQEMLLLCTALKVR